MEIRWEPLTMKSGRCSSLAWDSSEMQRCMDSLFGTQANERIVRLDVQREGLTAYFELENKPERRPADLPAAK